MADQSIRIMKKSLGEALSLLLAESVTNIEVNGRSGKVFIDGVGGREETGVALSQEQRLAFIGSVASYSGQTIGSDSPTLSAALPEELGSCRLEASIWPVTKGVSMAIRKPSTKIFPIEDYATDKQIQFIKTAIKEERNMLIAGSTDSGKTSLLKSILYLYQEVCPNDRMITMEDTEELVPVLKNTESMFTAGDRENAEGETLNMEWLVKSTLRRNPDRLIVGEVRGIEARAVLNGWDTGHNGGVCTFHAGSAVGGYRRFYRLAQLDWNNPLDQMLASENIDYILFVTKDKSGERGIREIVGVSYNPETQGPDFKNLT